MDSTHDDIVYNQIGENSILCIKYVVQEDHADLIGGDIPSRFKVKATKVCADVFKCLYGLSVDLQSEGFGSLGSARVDGD